MREKMKSKMCHTLSEWGLCEHNLVKKKSFMSKISQGKISVNLMQSLRKHTPYLDLIQIFAKSCDRSRKNAL
ncbi:hypothetical protein EUGRSUZ_H02127 [Eucalyptus grandis]|uniref:Uncharacterized protein n=2 Tax=Eucalyptus grandis TaxID=71139 RepID=A0ACC3JQS1_EUCGR|nr:hypothetical protein EUGRSUZ_H02127 [Eucalyptus grandis]